MAYNELDKKKRGIEENPLHGLPWGGHEGETSRK